MTNLARVLFSFNLVCAYFLVFAVQLFRKSAEEIAPRSVSVSGRRGTCLRYTLTCAREEVVAWKENGG